MNLFKNKNGQFRSFWQVFLTVGLCIGLIFLMEIVFSLGETAYIRATVVGSTAEIRAALDALMKANFWLHAIFQNILTITLSFFVWTKLKKKPLSEMGLAKFSLHYKEFIVGILFGIVSISLIFLILVSTGNAQVTSWTPKLSSQLIVSLIMMIFVGFGEEILVRGFVMSTLRQSKNYVIIIVFPALIFSFLHLLNPNVGLIPLINIFLVGVLFAYMYIKSGNIWMPIGYHISWNYFQGSVWGFYVSGIGGNSLISTTFPVADLFNGGLFGPEGGILTTLMILIGLAFVKWYYRNTHYDFLENTYKVFTSNGI